MLFTFGKWSSYYLYPLIAGILKLISFGGTLIIMYVTDDDENNVELLSLPFASLSEFFITYIFQNLLQILVIIIELFSIIKRSKKNTVKPIKTELAKTINKYQDKPLLSLFIIVSVIMETGAKVIYNYGVTYSISTETQYIIEQIQKGIIYEAKILYTLLQLPFIYLFFSFPVVCILNSFFLKQPIYKHHIVSLSFIIIFSLLYLLIITIKGTFSFGMFYQACGIGLEIGSDILKKWLMEKYYISAFELVALQGLFGFIGITIYFIINVLNTDSFLFHFSNFLNKFTFSLCGKYTYLFIVCSSFYCIYNNMTLKYLNVNFKTVILYPFALLFLIYSCCSDISYIPILVLYILLTLFSLLVFNELLLVHIWGMSENTQEMIKRRCQSVEKADEMFVSLAEMEDDDIDVTSENELQL